jgi:MraZ protein
MPLVGSYELAIDAKHRLSIPFGIRRELDPKTTGHSFYVTPGPRAGTLSLYPQRTYEALTADLPPNSDLSDEAYEWRQFELSHTLLVDPDSQGRVLIPEPLLKRAGIESEVTLIGVIDHLDLWRRDAYEEFARGIWNDLPQRRSRFRREVDDLRKAKQAARSAREFTIVPVVGPAAPTT